VAHVAFVLDAVFRTDGVTAVLEGVVHRINDHRLERMIALSDQLAGGQHVLPRVRGDLEHLQVVEARLGLEKDGLRKATCH
jgi:hypothetical protein